MKTKIDISEIKDKLYLKLTPSGWAIKLRGFIYSKEFDDILHALIKQVNDGKRFTPSLNNIFKAFEECPYNDLKMVIVTTNVNNRLEKSNGIPYSNNDDILPGLYNAIDKTVYNSEGKVNRSPDLIHWSNQGVLLLNINLTVTIGNLQFNKYIWDPFYKYLFDCLNWNNPGLIYLFQGQEAKKWDEFINDNTYKLYSLHPVTAFNDNNKEWESNNVFVEATDLIKKNYNYTIQW